MRVESQDRRAVRPRRALTPRALTSDLRPLTSFRRGLTLIELLVVIIILTTLVSAAIPIMAPTNDDRRLREASRSVNSYISAAQMKAVQLQRPFGVALKRLGQDTGTAEDNGVCLELFYVEQPAPYLGFDRTSAAMVARHPTFTGRALIKFVARGKESNADNLPVGWDADLIPQQLIRPNDVVEIDGTRYLLLVPQFSGATPLNLQTGTFNPAPGSLVLLEAQPLNDTGQMLSIAYDDAGNRLQDRAAVPQSPFWTNPTSYRILRQPMPASGEPFQLPEGTAIDLRASGAAIEFDPSTGRVNGFFHNPDALAPNESDRVNNSDPIIIMFTPEGAIERVRFNQKDFASSNSAKRQDAIYDARPVSNIFLLIGRRQNVPAPALTLDKTLDLANYPANVTEQQKQEFKEPVNWLLSESRWIVIGAQSGRVVTVENAFVDPGPLVTQYPTPIDVLRARQIHASREFAREMVQTGGR